MGIAALKKTQRSIDERAERDEAVRDDVFKRKVQGQQFLKHHGAILRALIRLAGSIDLKAHPGEFERRVLQARGLAVKVAARFLGKPEAEVTMEEARHYRQESSEIVAWCWSRGEDLDADTVAAEIAAAVSVADATYDADTMPWNKIGGDASLALTVVPAAMRLRRTVALYDFRLGPENVLGRLCEVVAQSAVEGVDSILPSEAGLSDRQSLFQSMLREYSSDMRVMYEEGARKTVAVLLTMPEADRQSYLDEMRPLDAIVDTFRGVAKRNTDLNAAAIRAMTEALAPQRQRSPGR